MNKRGSVRYAFASGNTSRGYQSFLPSLVEDFERVYILKGAPGSGRSTFIKQAGLAVGEMGFDAEFYVCPLNTASVEGVVFPQLKVAIVNGSLPLPVEPRYPGAIRDHLNLGDNWDRDEIVLHKEEIKRLVDEITAKQQRAYGLLREAETVRDKLKGIGLVGLDLKRLEALVQRLSQEFEGEPVERHYFGSSLSHQGLVSFIDELSQHCESRYIFKGPPGSGKSTVLAAIGQQAGRRGYKVEYYHNGLNPDSLDMIIITSRRVALIDGEGITLSSRPCDTIIDTGGCLDVQPDEDDLEINGIRRILESLLEEATEALREAESDRKQLQKIYTRAMDFSEIDRIRARVLEEII